MPENLKANKNPPIKTQEYDFLKLLKKTLSSVMSTEIYSTISQALNLKVCMLLKGTIKQEQLSVAL